MSKSILSFILTLISFSGFSQHKNYIAFWDALINNDREEATKKISKLNLENSYNYLISNELLRAEKGRLTENKAFIDAFLNHPELDYYLYALWNEPFIFDSYRETGFTNKNRTIIDKAFKKGSANNSIKDALLYLKSIKERELNNWETYFNLNNDISAVTHWQYCGVFENLNESGIDRVYLPESKAKSETPFDAASNGKVNWYTANNQNEAYQFFTNHEEYGSGVNYAQTFVKAKENKRVILRIGNGSAFKIWLNNVLLFTNNEDVDTELNAYQISVTIPKGNNRLLIKNSEKNYGSYFMLKVLNEDGTHASDLEFSSNYLAYNKSSKTTLAPKILENQFETFFKNKIKEHPNDFLYKYCLVNTYIRNSKYEEAKKILLPLIKKHPKSSLIRTQLLFAYTLENDYTSVQEIRENMENDDPDYYLPLVLKIADSKEISRMSISELETFLERFKASTDLELFDVTSEFYLNTRQGNRTALRENLDKLIEISKGNNQLLKRYAPIYASVFQDDETTIKLLEEMHNNYYAPSAQRSLAYYYDKKGKKDASLDVLLKDYNHLKPENYNISRIIKKLHAYERYDESLPYIGQMIKNFPYSFMALEYMGDALLQLEDKKGAIEAYETYLTYNNRKSIRKKLLDLKNETNPLNDLVVEDAYKFIKNNRKKITTNNYGFNILMSDSNIEIYPEGGGQYRNVYIYEVTSNTGVERFKEYNLGLSGDYNISKFEIVKEDGNIVPADKSDSSLVFTGLSVGDVIYLDYESTFSSYGRFYKDYTDFYQFESFHPHVISNLQIIAPTDINLNHKTLHGDVTYTKKKHKKGMIHSWELNNFEGLKQDESYMQNNVDVCSSVHISTINSWNDIAVWYSDLVRSRIEINNTVQDVFDNLFPNGHKQLSEIERALKIYNYIRETMVYSYVSFRQSGYVPQKPSKTINTALGDCKDFSTLFVTLGQMAELDTNLVLILTSNYGENALVLPSQDFNHCIVKVNLEGEEQYLELTDKYLPFGSLPKSLRNAIALEIPYSTTNNTNTFDLFKLKNAKRDECKFINEAEVLVNDANLIMNVNSTSTGHINSYYASVFGEPNKEVVKKSIYEDLDGRISNDFTLDELTNIKVENHNKNISFSTKLTINTKPQKIGSINIIQIPVLSHPYTKNIISLETREYPIDYLQYENLDTYKNIYNVIIPEGKQFIEIPQNVDLTFNNHSYKLIYTKIKDNQLKIEMQSKPSYKLIKPEDYQAFKTYVNAILEAEEAFVGYK